MRCDQCQYDYASVAREDLSERLRQETKTLVNEYESVELLHERPQPEVWSALEYACHVRDVLEVQRDRIDLAQVENIPVFEPMGREERAAGYGAENPKRVAKALLDNSDRLADTLDALDEAGWARTGMYNYPVRSERSVEWIATHTIHEVVHHHADIRAVGGGRVP